MMNRNIPARIASVGVWFDRRLAESMWKYGLNAFGIYVEEVLAHAGVPYRRIRDLDELKNGECDILVVALAAEDEPTAEVIWSFAASGRTVIAYAGLNRMAKRLHCEVGEPFGPGYAELAGVGKYPRLRYLRAQPWFSHEGGADSAAGLGILRDRSPDGAVIGAALQRFDVGAGTIERWAVDVPFTIVGLQQGTGPVLSDGVPSPDGTANIDDNILKADDRCAMDWRHDRSETATGQPYFARPYADYWREAIVSQLLRAALRQGLTLPFVDYWPEGVEQVAMISHDSDSNLDESALHDPRRFARMRHSYHMVHAGAGVHARVVQTHCGRRARNRVPLQCA